MFDVSKFQRHIKAPCQDCTKLFWPGTRILMDDTLQIKDSLVEKGEKFN
mgnify:CR=1 FL=1